MKLKRRDSSEAELTDAILRSERHAVHRFVADYSPRLYRFAISRVRGDPYMADDVVHAALLKAIRGVSRYRAEASLFTWLCGICRRQIVDHLRVERRHSARLVLMGNVDDLTMADEAAALEVEDSWTLGRAAGEAGFVVWHVLDRLPVRYSEVLRWKYMEGWSTEEIARGLGVGEIIVQSRLARARLAFRAALQPYP